jgi:putative ABC transport system permease protein
VQQALFGLSPTIQALILLAVTAGVVLFVVGAGLRNPVLLRMGLRNTVRRPTQTLIMLAGLVLSIIFITTSFSLQESFTASTSTARLAKVGTVNEAVSGTFTQQQVDAALTQLRATPQVQAATGMRIEFSSIVAEKSSLTTPEVYLVAVPDDFDQVYGPATDLQGNALHFSNLRQDAVFVTSSLAQDAGVRSGDQLRVQRLNSNTSFTVTVQGILSQDVLVTTGELAADTSFDEIVMSFSALQQIQQQVYHQSITPNTICIKNVQQGSADASTAATNSQAVLNVLQRLFHVAPVNPDLSGGTSYPTSFGSTLIHPLNPGIVQHTSLAPIISKEELTVSPAARQFAFLLPTLSSLLVCAGMLLLVLLCLLLATERRAELGMSRAIGLQRAQVVQSLIIEGSGYSLVATLVGVLLGVGATALELMILSHLPALGEPGLMVRGNHIPLYLSLSWQSVVSVVSLSMLVTILVVCIAALWISRMNIVAAIRDLDDPAQGRPSFLALFSPLWRAPKDPSGRVVPETAARRLSRRSGAIGMLVWELFVRSPLCLLLGGSLFFWSLRLQDSWRWMQQLGCILLIAGAGLLLIWILTLVRVPQKYASRLGFSLMGLGWIVYGLQAGSDIFLLSFAPDASAFTSFHRASFPSLVETMLDILCPLVGGVMVLLSNTESIANVLTALMRRLRPLAPISRTSLVYPLTFRFRTGVTISLLSLITFLVMLVVTNNLSAIQQSSVQTTAANFQLQITLTGTQDDTLDQQIRATPTSLRQDVGALSVMVPLYPPPMHGQLKPMNMHLPGVAGVTAYPANPPWPTIVDTTFLTNNSMPMFARALGYDSATSVWDTLRIHQGYGVLQYKVGLGLPTSDGFPPFLMDVPASNDAHAIYHQVTIIGIVPSNTQWQTLFLSQQTAATMVASPSTEVVTYLFRVQPGVSIAQASGDLSRTLNLGHRGIAITSLISEDRNTYTGDLTLFLGSYLALGLLFGAFSIGVITSRSVVERRQQIGMLRALGFSRATVGHTFLLEASFVILLSLVVGTVLAWLLVALTLRQVSQNSPFPLGVVVLLLLGSYLVAFLCIILPARQASRLPPAEALRYE